MWQYLIQETLITSSLPCPPRTLDKQGSKEKIYDPSEESPSGSILCSDEPQGSGQSGKGVHAPLVGGDQNQWSPQCCNGLECTRYPGKWAVCESAVSSSYLDRISANPKQWATSYWIRKCHLNTEIKCLRAVLNWSAATEQIFPKNLSISQTSPCPHFQGMHTSPFPTMPATGSQTHKGGETAFKAQKLRLSPLPKLQLKKGIPQSRARLWEKCPLTSHPYWSDKLIFLHIYSLNPLSS